MKAILVIDMPNTCCECKLFWNDVDCGCMALGRMFGEFGCSIGKPVDCPLKPMPQKTHKNGGCRVIDGQEWWYDSEHDEGWNDCIDEILGEENAEDNS